MARRGLTASVVPTGLFLGPVSLPQAGTYTWWADPSGSATGTLTLRQYDVVDVDGSITPDGTPVTATITVPGQRVALAFSGAAGQRASVQLDELTTDGSAWVAQPDGTVLGPVQAFSGGQVRFFETPVFPTSGTYRVFVDAVAHYTGAARVTLWTFTDVTGTLPAGTPTPVTFTTPGQQARLTFTGTAGGTMSLRTTMRSGPLGTSHDATVLRPDGSVLVTASLGFPGFGFLDATPLPVDGAYTVIVDLWDTSTGSLHVIRYDVVDATAGATLNGGPVPLALTTPGQNARVSLPNATAGTVATVGISGNAVGALTLTLQRPDGTTQASTGSSATSVTLGPQTLAAGGTYTVVVDPAGAATGSLSVEATSP
jgi:hypothetical protein